MRPPGPPDCPPRRGAKTAIALLTAALIATAAPARALDAEQYVGANLLASFYHELGHALIHVMDLPIFGQEEDAADVLSALMLQELFEEEAAAAMVHATAMAFLYDARAQEADGGTEYWGIHGPDRQRYYTLVCLFYGGNPDLRRGIADALGLPRDRAETCAEEFDVAMHSWGAVLDRLYDAGPGDSLRLQAARAGRSRWARVTRDVIAAEVDALNAEMSLPVPIAVRVEPCGEANAFYDLDARAIIMCTEFAGFLARQVAR